MSGTGGGPKEKTGAVLKETKQPIAGGSSQDAGPLTAAPGKASNVIYLHDLGQSKPLLRNLNVLSCQPSGSQDYADVIPDATSERMKDLKISSSMACSSCNTTFESTIQQRAHYKLDWHSFNLKQKLKGSPPVTEDIYAARTADNATDNLLIERSGKLEGESETPSSPRRRQRPTAIPPHFVQPDGGSRRSRSASQSSTDTEDETSSTDDNEDYESRRNPKLLLQNGDGTILSLYRCVVHSKQNVPPHDGALVRAVCNVCDRLQWAIIMVGGGYFAGAIFDGKEPVVHKTIHRYVVRKAQGTSQGSRDNKQGGSHPRSGGASLRRHNELHFVQDVQTVLESWSPTLQQSHAIFYHAPGANKTILFGGRFPPLRRGDARLRTIPFPTARASFQELQRIHLALSSVECYNDIRAAQLAPTIPPPSPQKRAYKGTRTSSHRGSKKGGKENAQDSLKKSHCKQGPPCDNDLSDGDSDGEVSLVAEEVVRDTLGLRMFEGTRKPRGRHKRHREVPDDNR